MIIKREVSTKAGVYITVILPSGRTMCIFGSPRGRLPLSLKAIEEVKPPEKGAKP